jgi:oligosaccharyltransferase complex subunit gamma
VLPFLPLLLLTAGADDLVAVLQSLRARSPSGVIHLTGSSVTRFLSAPAPRPYSVLAFFDASAHHSKPGLHLPQLRSEFGLLAASFNAHNPGSSDLFFADIEFAESQHSFHQFGVDLRVALQALEMINALDYGMTKVADLMRKHVLVPAISNVSVAI